MQTGLMGEELKQKKREIALREHCTYNGTNKVRSDQDIS